MNLNELLGEAGYRAYDQATSIKRVIVDGVFDAIKKANKEIVDQVGADNFNSHIMSLPKKIHDQSEVLRDARYAFEQARANIVNAESMLMAAITAEVNDAGKPRFTNDITRKAELDLRKKYDADYIAAWEPYRVTQEDMDNAQFLLTELENEFKAYQVMGQILAARLGLMRVEI